MNNREATVSYSYMCENIDEIGNLIDSCKKKCNKYELHLKSFEKDSKFNKLEFEQTFKDIKNNLANVLRNLVENKPSGGTNGK
jgi:septation ring formation regulator EzrA